MTKKKHPNRHPLNPQDGKFYRSVTLGNDYRLRLPHEIVDALQLDEVSTLVLYMGDSQKLIVEVADKCV